MASGDQLGAHVTQRHRNNNDDGDGADIERKRELFSKKVRKSDVGKVQRLIIPEHLDEEQERQKKFAFNDDKHRLGIFLGRKAITMSWKSFVKCKKLKVGDFLCFDRWKYSLSFITARNMMRRTNMMANQFSVKVKAATPMVKCTAN